MSVAYGRQPQGARGAGRAAPPAPRAQTDPVDADELQRWDTTWSNTQVQEPGTGAAAVWPDGAYVGQITGIGLTRTKRDSTPMFFVEFMVLGGPKAKGGTYTHRRVLKDSDAVKYLRQECHNMGYDPELISQIPSTCQDVMDVVVSFALKSRTLPARGNDEGPKTYQNCYINRWIEPDDVDAAIAAAGGGDGPEAAEDEVPF